MTDRSLTRRRLLAVLGGIWVTGGCLELSSDDESPSNRTDTPESSSTPTSTEPDESPSGESQATIYVDPAGDDTNPGTKQEPLRTVDKALQEVQPGETVYLTPGEYTGRVVTINPAKPDQPITITGSKDAVIRPSEEVREDDYYPINIQHSHYRLTGVTITGLHTPAAPEQVDSYLRRLMQVSPPPDSEEYLENVVVAPHGVGNCQRALISVVRVKDSEFGPFKTVGPAGVEYLYGDEESHIGEILYIGQPLQVYADGASGYFWDTYEQTRNLHIHHIDNSEGYHHAEMVDLKDGTRNITVEYCTDGGGSRNNDPFSPQSIHVRGHDCTIRWNRLQGGEGNGVEIYKPGSPEVYPEFGFDEEVIERIATDNEVYGNEIYDFEERAIALDEDTKNAQRHICGNDIRGETNGNPEKECPEDLPDGDGVGHTGGDSPYTS